MTGWFRRIVARFRRSGRPPSPLHVAPEIAVPPKPREQPYFVQIGFDFGTAFSKCVCRDVITNRAWVHRPKLARSDLPFLIPSDVFLEAGILSRDAKRGRLSRLKMALSRAAQRDWEADDLQQFRAAALDGNEQALQAIIEACATYHVAEALAGVRAEINGRFKDFGEHAGDYAAINMALPVADAEKPAVHQTFSLVLLAAWRLSVQIRPGQQIPIEQVLRHVETCRAAIGNVGECCVYPEVSANVQGFVRSRVSSPGVYLFCDTGAGTVDQSVFIFNRSQSDESSASLTYLHAAVLGLGSGQLEVRAAAAAGTTEATAVEAFRLKKEAGTPDHFLLIAGHQVGSELDTDTIRTLKGAKDKLYWKDQLTRTRVIFGGGGHALEPYETGTLQAFRSQIFAHPFRPDTLGMPMPSDLEIAEHDRPWLKRLSVAYGLSFVRQELTPFIYPVAVEKPTRDQLWRPKRQVGHAPSKDEV